MSRKQKFKDLADEIIRMIDREGLASGDRLPSEKQLAQTYGINHLTVRKALEVLGSQGVIHKIPSKGNFVGSGGDRQKSKSGLIGIIFPEDEAFFFEVTAGLESRMSLFGYTPLINISRRSIDREKAALENFLRLGVDGIIAAPNENCAEYYRDLDVPVVFFDTFISGLKVPYVGTDDLKGACDAVELLVSLGHKKIAYIGARNDLTASQRIQGYKEVMNKHGLELNSDYILEKEYSRQWGYNGADVLFKLETPPTALFCGNDTIASGVLAYMSNRGLRCPEHLSIAGFGNLGLSEGLGLTTVSQSCHDISNSVWSAMLTLINGDSAIQQTILPTSLIVRQSTAMLIN